MELTDKQKEDIINKWESNEKNPPALLELIRIAFPDKNVDGRSKEGRLVKEFLATRDISARGAHQYKTKKPITLTEEQKEFITNNVQIMKANEMSRVLFDDRDLTPLSQETRTVNDYIKTLGPTENAFQNTQDIPNAEYKPPRTPGAMISRINKYVHEGINKDKVSIQQKKDIQSLIGFLSTYRFLHHINNYTSQTDRELYESSFVRYTYNKADLSQEEVDQYIVLSVEVVIAANIQRRVERLQTLMDDLAEDTEGRRVAMGLVEAISTNQTEYNQCINRQNKLLDSLKEKRSDKLKKQIGENASILNLVQVWKDEETRKQMINLAEMRKKRISEEVEKLSDIDELKGRIMGLSKEEGLNG